MRRERLPIDALALWAKLNSVELHGVAITDDHDGRGSRVVASSSLKGHGSRLMTIPKELSLSKDRVWEYAKVDKHLREVLEALDDFTLFARYTAEDWCLNAVVRILQISSLPTNLPVFWTAEEREMLAGTTLQSATNAKLSSLDREFGQLRAATQSIDWCARYWWDSDSGCLSLEDWKAVDAMYRSRAMELPVIGHCMVPVLDMCNHDSDPLGHYNVDDDGNGVLLLDSHRELSAGSEMTISYGDGKGACEMLFSYGFLEESMKNAQSIFLPFDIPDDDPLKYAKLSVFHGPSGFRIYDAGLIKWASTSVWLACVNEEDGLGFDFAQTNEGHKELQVTWKGKTLESPEQLGRLLASGMMWDVFRLRATSLIHQHVEAEIRRRLEISQGLDLGDGDVERARKHFAEDGRQAQGQESTNLENSTVFDLESSHLLQQLEPADLSDDENDLATSLSQTQIAPLVDDRSQEIHQTRGIYAVVRNGKRVKVESSDENVFTATLAEDGQRPSQTATSSNGRQDSHNQQPLERDVSTTPPNAASFSHDFALQPNDTVNQIDSSQLQRSERPSIGRQIAPTKRIPPSTTGSIQKLKRLELGLLYQAHEEFTHTISTLAASDSIQRYLAGDEPHSNQLVPSTRSSTPSEPTEEKPSLPMDEVANWGTDEMAELDGSTEAVEQHRRRVQANEAWEPDDFW